MAPVSVIFASEAGPPSLSSLGSLSVDLFFPHQGPKGVCVPRAYAADTHAIHDLLDSILLLGRLNI